jgi:hypothetical protein
MDDLTIMYISASKMPESWVKFQVSHLLHAADGAKVISITRKPLALGDNISDEEPETSYWNLYRQMLRAARIALTPYVAMAEDDTLYSREHFTEFRPPKDAVSYNRARWSLFQWDPIYCIRQRVSNCTLIAPRNLLIEALEERERKYPNGNSYVGEVGRSIVERRLGVTRRTAVEWYSTVPVIQLNHRTGTDTGGGHGTGRVKKHGQIKAYRIPFWGESIQIARHYGRS